MTIHRCTHAWPAFVRGQKTYRCPHCRSVLDRDPLTGELIAYSWHAFVGASPEMSPTRTTEQSDR